MSYGGGREMMGSGGGIDPSDLHLKKELTQIRKAARVLRDPGTSSSWRSPLNSARSLTKHHYVHHHKNGHIDGYAIASSPEQFLQLQLQVESNNNRSNGNTSINKGNVNVKEKERKVFLYNWRSQKSESERSRQIDENYVENEKDEVSYWTQEDSVDVDSLSDARNDGGKDSKTDAYLSDRYVSSIFNCKDTNFMPSIRRTIKKKPKRSNHFSPSLLHSNEKLQNQILLSRCVKNMVEGLPSTGLGRDNLVSLVDQSDDTEDYCYSEDMRRTSATPLLARLKNKCHRKEDDSVSISTPALSTSSYNRNGFRNPSTVKSWDATTGSLNDADNEVDDQLDFPTRQGCGIPCYWSKRSTPKSRVGFGSCYSPSLSDTLRRKGSSILCGSQTNNQRRHHSSSLASNKRRMGSRTAAQSVVPLLTNSFDCQGRPSMGNGNCDHELPSNFEELDLEALSRLDGKRWSSSCRSQDGIDVIAPNGEIQEEGSPENARSLSHKYRPMTFEELIGQNIVFQSLTSALLRGRIAPVYLFLGPRGTGKTSSAKIFAAALNCLATNETKPCGVCMECADFISGTDSDLVEVDGSNKKGIEKIENVLRTLSGVPPLALSKYKVFVVDECHLLPSKTWQAFLGLLEKPQPRVVFILVTTAIDNVPRTILSRCRKLFFNKISNGDIVTRLRKIAADENLDVELDALELIASNADASLRDAETMLDQLSLIGKRITTSLVNELIGVVSDEKLLDLLELAMSSNASETVKRARELMNSGADPIVLMSQMATLIVDIIAGTYSNIDSKQKYSIFGGRNLSEREIDRLKHALTLLSEAEKHLRVSSERSTWFTATLLQLGSMPSLGQTHSGSRQRLSSKTTEEDHKSLLREVTAQKQRTDAQFAPEKSGSPPSFAITAHRNSTSKDNPLSLADAASVNSNCNQSQISNGDALVVSHDECGSGNGKVLIDIWLQCIEQCHSKTLRQLLRFHGKLVSIFEVKGGYVAHIAFADSKIKTGAEGFLSSITNSFEIVLQCNVEVKLILLPDSFGMKQIDKNLPMNLKSKLICLNRLQGNSDVGFESLKVPRGSFNECEDHQTRPFESTSGNGNPSTSKESFPVIPVQRVESIIREQRLETAWLHAMEKGTPGSISHLKPERDQVLPQDDMYHRNQFESMNLVDLPLQHWEDELNCEIKALKIHDEMSFDKERIVKRINRYPISPSLLHNNSFASNFSKENMGYESGSGTVGCSSLFCWNDNRPHRRGKAHTPIRTRKMGRFSWFGECIKSRTNKR